MTRHRIDPLLLPRLALLVPACVLLSTTVADPDLWGHLRSGGDILAARALPVRDTYSFTSDRSWGDHEWLGEAIFAAVYGGGGAVGLIVLRLALLAATLLLVARALHRSGVPSIARDLLIVFVVVGTYPAAHTVRPQLFSLLAFAWLLSCVSEYERRGWRALAFVPVMMALWVNLHGGWIVGLGTLAVWVLATLLTPLPISPTPTPPATRRAHAPLVMLLVAAAGATVINPYGTGLWRFMAETVGFTRADISEWQPLIGAAPLEIALWVTACALGVWGAAVARLRPGALAVLAILAPAALRVRRLEAFFVLSTMMLAGPALARRARPSPVGAAGPARADALPTDRLAPRRVAAAVAAALAAIVLISGTTRPSGRFGCIDSSDPRLPDPDAGAFLRKDPAVRGRMLTWFDWGEYAIWHLAPKVQVSIDGRRETVYSEALVRAHLDFYFNRDSLALLDRLRPDFVWLRSDLPVVPSLDARGWRRVFDGSRSVVFRAPGAGEAPQGQPDSLPPRGAPPQDRACFPG